VHLRPKKPKYRTAESYTWHTESWITLGVLPQPLSEEWVLLVPQALAELSHTVRAQNQNSTIKTPKSRIQNPNPKIQDPESKIEDQKKNHNPKDPKSKSQNSKLPQDPKI